MSRIDKLIAKLCPDGVEFKKLGEITVIKRGERVTKADIVPSGKYPIISGGTKPLGIYDKYNRDPDTITIAQYGTAGFVDWQYDYFWANDVCYSVYPFDILNNRYLYFTLLKLQDFLYSIRTNAVPAHLPIDKLKSIEIPIPPLPIQQEIVRILDTFTDLDAELQAELEARKKQYEHYRNQLLNFEGKEVEWNMIKDLYDFKNGLNKGKDYFGKGTPIVNFTDVYYNRALSVKDLKGRVEVTSKEKSLYSAYKNDIFFTRTSETQEDIGMVAALIDDIEDCVFSGFVLRARPKTYNLNPKFVSLYLSSYTARNEIVRYSSFTTRALTSGPRLSKINIPIPPLSEQEHILSMLDKFEALVNEELPAEIAARRKQYEYYREKLLTFKKAD